MKMQTLPQIELFRRGQDKTTCLQVKNMPKSLVTALCHETMYLKLIQKTIDTSLDYHYRLVSLNTYMFKL